MKPYLVKINNDTVFRLDEVTLMQKGTYEGRYYVTIDFNSGKHLAYDYVTQEERDELFDKLADEMSKLTY